jgi:hypothetical protein
LSNKHSSYKEIFNSKGFKKVFLIVDNLMVQQKKNDNRMVFTPSEPDSDFLPSRVLPRFESSRISESLYETGVSKWEASSKI